MIIIMLTCFSVVMQLFTYQSINQLLGPHHAIASAQSVVWIQKNTQLDGGSTLRAAQIMSNKTLTHHH